MSITAHIFGVNRQTPRSTALGRFWQQLAIATNWPVLLSIAVLCALGVCSIWADKGQPTDGKKQLLFIAIGFCCLVAFQAVNYQKIGRFAWGFYLIAILLIKDAPRPGTPEDKTPVAKVEPAPIAQPEKKPDAAPAQPADAGKPGATPDCDKELRRTTDLLRFFANRIQAGEDTQTVVADMRQQEKKIAAVCD